MSGVFGIRVRDQDPNRSSPRDGCRESPSIANMRGELFSKLRPQRRFTPYGSTDHAMMAQGSRRRVARISAPDYPLLSLRCLQVAPGKPEGEHVRGPLPIPQSLVTNIDRGRSLLDI